MIVFPFAILLDTGSERGPLVNGHKQAQKREKTLLVDRWLVDNLAGVRGEDVDKGRDGTRGVASQEDLNHSDEDDIVHLAPG